MNRLKSSIYSSILYLIFLHQTFLHQNFHMSFFIKDDELLDEYNEVWEKVKNSIKKEFGSESAYIEKYLKAKIKSNNG